MVSRIRHGLTEIRVKQICFISSKMAFELVDEENAPSQASLVLIKVFEKATHEFFGNMLEKCGMMPLDKLAG